VTDSLDEFADAQRWHSLRRENDRLKARLKAADDQLAAALQRLDVLEGIDRLNPRPPKWTTPKRPRSGEVAVVAMLSDTHWDVIVRPEDVGGINAYDRDIATTRTKSWAQQLAALPQVGPTADVAGLVLLWAGDMMNGPIDAAHLVDAADTTLGTLLYWSEQAAAAITLLADAYGRVHIPVVVGNHGRQTMKVRTSLRARDNLDWHLAHLVRRQLAGDDRVTWQIDEATDAEFELFNDRHVVTHGDQAKGGGGIGGIWPPLMRLAARKQQRQASLGRPFSGLWMGHWHQATWGDAFVVNGSLIGHDGWAATNNFPVRPPEQVAAIVTPSGIEWRTTIRPEG
jgi:hypothetical protein